MNNDELSRHRQYLFESIEGKLDDLYYATRSIRYANEMREYVLVVLLLMREYLEVHGRNFRIKRLFHVKGGGDFISTLINETNYNVLQALGINEHLIKKEALTKIRWHFSWIFSKILEIHTTLEHDNTRNEYEKRYMQVGPNMLLKPRKGVGTRRAWDKRSGNSGPGSVIEKWSGVFRARYSYECMSCPNGIHKGQLYEKEVIRLGDSVEILRNHLDCTGDPNDPLWDEERNEGDNTLGLDKAA